MKPLKFISISDIHLGHYKVPAMFSLENLRKYLYPHLNSELDILFIAGDVTETLLTLNAEGAFALMTFIEELQELSNECGFLIRVLKGTSEHEYDQLKYFKVAKKGSQNTRVIEQMTVEHIDKYNLDVLYIPDDLPYQNAQSEALRKIKEQGLKMVDICVLHGFCKHEIPPNVPIQPFNLFDAETLMKWTRGPILKGHVHKKSIYKRVISNGSFERNCHGDEGKKGFFLIEMKEDRTFSYKFIENMNTMIFKDVLLGEEDIVREFDRKMKEILLTPSEQKVYIRLVCSRKTKLQINPHDFKYDRRIVYSYLLLDDKEAKVIDQTFMSSLEKLEPITRQNLSTLTSSWCHGRLSSERIEQIFKTVEVT